ncbi:hypothetical protein AB6802_14360 [Mesorhizobium sp. RCC_202]|uniref:hypothetical protein n=1 Tax=Mesorhizobium sp. RCC_202 TaxID=3239222 RepID=UPI0035263E75
MSETINTLDELLNDPMVQLVMARDRVQPAELRTNILRARSKIDEALPPAHVVAKTCLQQWLHR